MYPMPPPNPLWYRLHELAGAGMLSGIMVLGGLITGLYWASALAGPVFALSTLVWAITRAPAKALDAAHSAAYDRRRAAYLASHRGARR
jgi:hypothetical protein